MKLYVNGDSHTAAAEAVNPHAFAEDDADLFDLGRRPHPDNFAVSWPRQLSQLMKADLECDAESASSNDRILRTTRAWLSQNRPDLVIIQWSTWEREEWLHNDCYFQVTASGTDHVPPELVARYKSYIANLDWNQKTMQAHENIWQLHDELRNQNIPHVFFNGNNCFDIIGDPRFGIDCQRRDWGNSYLGPYDPELTFDRLIRNQGIQTVTPSSWHFGKDGHRFFAQFMLQYCIDNKFI